MDLRGFKPTAESPLRDQALAFMTLEDSICHTQVSYLDAFASFDAASKYIVDSAKDRLNKAAETLVGWCDTYQEKYAGILKAEMELSKALAEKGIPFSTLFNGG